MQTVSHSEACEDALIDRIVVERVPVKIVRLNGSDAVLISEKEWASIEETMYLLGSPKNAERLLKAVRGFETADEGVPLP